MSGFRVNPRRLRDGQRKQRPTVVAFENVEPRRMMSITQLPIVITGTSSNDTIDLHFEHSGGHDWFVWHINGQGHALKDWDPAYIEIDGYGGNDTIKVNSTRPAQDLRVNGGDGNDSLSLGVFGSSETFDYFHFGTVTVNMGTGQDYLNVYSTNSNTPDVDDIYTTTKYQLNEGGVNHVTRAPIIGATVNYSGVEGLQWYGPNQPTKWMTNSTAMGTDYKLYGGNAIDDFVTGGGDLDSNIFGDLHLYSGGGSTNYVGFDDLKDAYNDSYTLNDHTITKNVHFGAIEFRGFQNVFLYASSYDNTISLESALWYQHFYLMGNAGNDHFVMVNSTHNLLYLGGAKVNCTGGTGKDEIFIPDEVQKHDSTVSLTDTGMVQNGVQQISFVGMGRAVVQLSSAGKDVVNVTPSRVTQFEINAGSANQVTPLDEISLNLYGVTNPSVSNVNSQYKIYFFGNRKPVYGVNFKKYPGAFNADTMISGTVFNDLNGDGLRDPFTENALVGRTVFVDLNNDGKLNSNELSTTVDQYGNFQLYNLVPGTYTLRTIVPAGWKQTSPIVGQAITIALGANQKIGNVLFGTKKLF
jgi:hypothetical protein